MDEKPPTLMDFLRRRSRRPEQPTEVFVNVSPFEVMTESGSQVVISLGLGASRSALYGLCLPVPPNTEIHFVRHNFGTNPEEWHDQEPDLGRHAWLILWVNNHGLAVFRALADGFAYASQEK